MTIDELQSKYHVTLQCLIESLDIDEMHSLLDENLDDYQWGRLQQQCSEWYQGRFRIVWEELEEVGVCDGIDGSQYERVWSEWLALPDDQRLIHDQLYIAQFIGRRANLRPDEDPADFRKSLEHLKGCE